MPIWHSRSLVYFDRVSFFGFELFSAKTELKQFLCHGHGALILLCPQFIDLAFSNILCAVFEKKNLKLHCLCLTVAVPVHFLQTVTILTL